jgi:hypothetical protein
MESAATVHVNPSHRHGESGRIGGIAMQIVPVPVYPMLQTHEFVPGPVIVQVAFTSHPPLLVVHGLTAAHVWPLPA